LKQKNRKKRQKNEFSGDDSIQADFGFDDNTVEKLEVASDAVDSGDSAESD
jgi:hypothetical protein